MSNYYLKTTDGTGAAMTLHIGKAPARSVFIFQSIDTCDHPQGPQEITVGGLTIAVTVPKLMLRSRDEWLAYLSETTGTILDEHGVELTLSELQGVISEYGPDAVLPDGRRRKAAVVLSEGRSISTDPAGYAVMAGEWF